MKEVEENGDGFGAWLWVLTGAIGYWVEHLHSSPSVGMGDAPQQCPVPLPV